MNNDAHILTALQAACAFGRKQYDERMRWKDYDCSRAIAALRDASGDRQETPGDALVVGGGNSLTGKIKWLLENRGAMTRVELAEAIGCDIESVVSIVASLRNKSVVSVEGRGNDAKFFLRKAVGV